MKLKWIAKKDKLRNVYDKHERYITQTTTGLCEKLILLKASLIALDKVPPPR